MAPQAYPQIASMLGYTTSVHLESEQATLRNLTEDRLFGSAASCGVSSLHVLQADPAMTVRKVLVERAITDKHVKEAFVVFSDIYYKSAVPGVERTRNNFGGHNLAKYIADNKIGVIVETEPRQNPNTRNWIKLWVWSPPHADISDKFADVHGRRKVFVGSVFERYEQI